jgi:hypothetical protein
MNQKEHTSTDALSSHHLQLQSIQPSIGLLSSLLPTPSNGIEVKFPLFDHITASKILNIHLSPSSQLDKLCWVPNSNGIHSVKSTYLTDQKERFSSSGPLAKSDWNIIWKANINLRYKTLLWKIAWDILPTKVTLAVGIPTIDTTCHLCND